MNYHIEASSISNQDAVIHLKQSNIDFGSTTNTAEMLRNPAELYFGLFADCILKNVKKFGTVYDTLKLPRTISGSISNITNV